MKKDFEKLTEMAIELERKIQANRYPGQKQECAECAECVREAFQALSVPWYRRVLRKNTHGMRV